MALSETTKAGDPALKEALERGSPAFDIAVRPLREPQ
jgi:hypothetical protein